MKSVFLLCEYDISINTVLKLYKNNITLDLINIDSNCLDYILGANGVKTKQILSIIKKINQSDKMYSIYDLIRYGLSKKIIDDLYKNNISIFDITEKIKADFNIGNVTYQKIKSAYDKFIEEQKVIPELNKITLFEIIKKYYQNNYFNNYELKNILLKQKYSVEKLDIYICELISENAIDKYKERYFIPYTVDILLKYGLSKNIVEILKGNEIELSEIDNKMKEKYHISDGNFKKIILAYNEFIKINNVCIKLNKNRLYEYIDKEYPNSSFDFNDLKLKLDNSNFNTNNLNDLIYELVLDRKLEKTNEKFLLIYPNLIDRINKISNKNNHRDIVMRKLEGQTLEQIGKFYNVTRERIRQIYSKEINKIQNVEEDKLKKYIEKYNFTSEFFCEIFNVEKYIFYYLRDRYGIGDIEISELLDNPNLDEKQIDIIKKKFNIINYNEENIIANKNSILIAFLKKVESEVEYSELIINYNSIIKDYNLSLDLLGEYDLRNIDSILERSNYTLSALGRVYRYYNIEEIDNDSKEELRKLLDIEPGVYSSELFFDDNVILMKKLDIRNEYELHNILKKLFSKIENVVFSRMPDIFINCSSKKTFFESQINELSPISIDEFIEYIYQNYGHKTNSFRAYITTNFSKYINNNMIVSDSPEFTDEQVISVKKILTDNIYSINTVKELMTSLFNVNDFKLLNNLNLSKLGYKLRGNYIMKSNISSLEAFMKEQIMLQDYYIITPEIKQIGSTFSSYLYKFMYDKKLFKIEDNKYITIKKLNDMGIYEEDIDDFINDINKILPDNEYFNLYTLNVEFKSKIFDYNFPDCFYETLIMIISNIKSLRLNNNTIFIKTSKNTTREIFINSFINKEKIYICEIRKTIEQKFDIHLQDSYVRQFINRKKYYFDIGTDCVYKDKDSYDNEVNKWDILQYID